MGDRLLHRSASALVVVAAVAALGFGSPALAVDADELLEKGTELRRQGRDAEALAQFQEAARLHESPRAIAQIALCEQALGLWVDANLHLTQALDKGEEPWIVKNRAALDGALSTIRAHLCRLEVWGTPAGAEVSVDGKRVGALPGVTTWAAVGEVSLEVKAAGYSPWQRLMKTPERGSLREHVTLRDAAAAPSVSDQSGERRSKVETNLTAAPPNEAPALVAKPLDATLETAGDAPTHHRWWLWTLVGVGVLAGGVTAALLLTHHSGPTCDPATCSTWN
jgi:tetratricopeptide (TPR) repeat protein